jgi:predicted nucleic acid-binding protein
MPIFVDTGFWIALKNKDDDFHSEAESIWKRVVSGELSELYTTDYILDEAITHARTHKNWGTWARGQEVGEMILNSDKVRVIHVEEKDCSEGWVIYQKYQDKELSFTDCVSMAVMDRLGVTELLGFDGGFEKVGRGYNRNKV